MAGMGRTKMYTSMMMAQLPWTKPEYSALEHRLASGALASGSYVSPMCAAQNIG